MINYIENRKKIFEVIENNSVVILHSGYDQHKSADAVRKYEVNKNFYYLTGINQKDVKLVMIKIDDQELSWLFIDEIDEKYLEFEKRTTNIINKVSNFKKENISDLLFQNVDSIVIVDAQNERTIKEIQAKSDSFSYDDESTLKNVLKVNNSCKKTRS